MLSAFVFGICIRKNVSEVYYGFALAAIVDYCMDFISKFINEKYDVVKHPTAWRVVNGLQQVLMVYFNMT